MVTHSTVLAWRIPWTEEPGDRVTGSNRTEAIWHTQDKVLCHSPLSWFPGGTRINLG